MGKSEMAVSVNLNDLTLKAIGVPGSKNSVTNKYEPYYTKISGYKGDEYESRVDRDLDWRIASGLSYNSPNNIRRVAITRSGIFVTFYTSYINKGKRSKALNEVDRAISKDYSNIPIKLKGSLSWITLPRMISNIEEIYYDDLIPISQATEFLGEQVSKELEQGLKASDEKYIIDTEKLLSQDIKKLGITRDKFPRLRRIGYIQNLGSYLSLYNAGIQVIKLSGGTDNFLDYLTDESSRMALPQIRSHIIDITKYFGAVQKFECRPGIYQFDAQILSPIFQKIEQDEETRRQSIILDQQSKLKEEKRLKDNTPSEFEELLDSSLPNIDPKYHASIIYLTLINQTKADKQAISANLSKSGRERYGKYLTVGGK